MHGHVRPHLPEHAEAERGGKRADHDDDGPHAEDAHPLEAGIGEVWLADSPPGCSR